MEVLLQTKSLPASPGGGRWRKKPCAVVQVISEHVEYHTQIVKEIMEMKERDDHDKIQVRESVKRSLQSGQPNDPVDVERFDKIKIAI